MFIAVFEKEGIEVLTHKRSRQHITYIHRQQRISCRWERFYREQHAAAVHGDLDDLARALDDVRLAIVQCCSVLGTVHTAD